MEQSLQTQCHALAGTFRGSTRRNGEFQDCLPCPHGSSCIQATVTPAACQAGYTCPLGTQYATQFPCRAGTYTAATNLLSQEGCTQCGLGDLLLQLQPLLLLVALETITISLMKLHHAFPAQLDLIVHLQLQ